LRQGIREQEARVEAGLEPPPREYTDTELEQFRLEFEREIYHTDRKRYTLWRRYGGGRWWIVYRSRGPGGCLDALAHYEAGLERSAAEYETEYRICRPGRRPDDGDDPDGDDPDGDDPDGDDPVARAVQFFRIARPRPSALRKGGSE
jgi:hypothetical protein